MKSLVFGDEQEALRETTRHVDIRIQSMFGRTTKIMKDIIGKDLGL